MYVYSVNVYPSSTTIKTGNWYYGAYAVVNASSNCNTGVRWYSNNTSVATVNASSGYIYAKAPGTTRIYAQSTVDSSKKDYISVTVTSGTICVDSVTLNRSSISLEKGDTFTLTATICPTNATNKTISWRSSNTSVATVSGGVVTAKARGYAYIYAEAQDGSGEYDFCYVNVTEDILVTSVTVSPSSKTMNIGNSAYLYETVCPTNATNKCVKWSSNKTSVATVNPDTGLVIARGSGIATITATAQDGSKKKGYCTITVNAPVAVTAVEVCPTSLTMNVGDIEYLCASIMPYNATNQTVTWCSSNENVATVGLYTGKITAKKAGSTTITATTADGGYQDCMTITVNYCGGSNYRDVTKHNMVLQCDGYYECSVCGYRVKSPALQDKDILNNEDYYKVLCCYLSIPYYSTLENKNNVIYIPTSTLLSKIDDIRSQSEYASKYEYAGNDGIYIREYSEQNNLIFPPLSVGYNDITSSNLWLHNGVADALVNFAFGFFVPNAYKPFFVAATSNNVYDGVSYLLSDLAQKAGYPEIGIILDLIVLGASEDDSIKVNDKVIYVSTFDGVTTIQSKFVFSSDGVLKGQYNSHKTNKIIA